LKLHYDAYNVFEIRYNQYLLVDNILIFISELCVGITVSSALWLPTLISNNTCLRTMRTLTNDVQEETCRSHSVRVQ